MGGSVIPDTKETMTTKFPIPMPPLVREFTACFSCLWYSMSVSDVIQRLLNEEENLISFNHISNLYEV